MADDEGAAYWEAVYGQPLHTYSQYYTSTTKPSRAENNPTGSTHGYAAEEEPPNVHRMTDDEYVDFVRRKMWEKSHGFVFEERARREEERKRRRRRRRMDESRREEGMGGRGEKGSERWREGGERMAGGGGDWQRGVEEALKRGEERRKRAKWNMVWEGYVRGWEGMRWELGSQVSNEGLGKSLGEKQDDSAGLSLRERIPWPVESGKWEDVEKGGVESFFGQAPMAAAAVAAAAGRGKGMDVGEVLKKERVRWHPDKMQQRAGDGGMDAETLKTVTAVFQVVDRMWGEIKEKKK